MKHVAFTLARPLQGGLEHRQLLITTSRWGSCRAAGCPQPSLRLQNRGGAFVSLPPGRCLPGFENRGQFCGVAQSIVACFLKK